jgi:hypothetical protein
MINRVPEVFQYCPQKSTHHATSDLPIFLANSAKKSPSLFKAANMQAFEPGNQQH